MKADTITKAAVLSVLLGCMVSAMFALLSGLSPESHTVQLPAMPPNFVMVRDRQGFLRYKVEEFVSRGAYESVAQCWEEAWNLHSACKSEAKLLEEVAPVQP